MNRIHWENREAEPKSQNRRGLIIETDEDGFITLKPDFVELFRRLTSLPEYYLQTRHAYATLIARRRQIELRSIESSNLIADCEKSLQLDSTSNHRMYARVSRCECCESPGRIEVRNKRNFEVLQICCSPLVKALDWGRIIAESSSEEAECHVRIDRERYPFIPKLAKKVAGDPSQITKFFELLRERSIEFVATLKTDGIIHSERILAKKINCSGGVLIIEGFAKTLRLNLAAARSLFSVDTDGFSTIYVAGNQNVLLLSIETLSATRSDELFAELD